MTQRAPIDRRAWPALRLLAVMICLIVSLTWALGFTVDHHDLPLMAAAIGYAFLMGFAFRAAGLSRIATAIEGMALIVASTMAVCCLSILLATDVAPFRDDVFDGIDRILFPNLGWLDMFHALRSHGALIVLMSTVYSSLLWQPFALVAVLALTGDACRVWRFLHAWFLALAICVTVFAFAPALGPYAFHHLGPEAIPAMRLRIGWDTVTVLEAVRSGALRTLDPSSMTGIIAFPSFHAAGGTLLAWAFRRVAVIGWPFVAWNVAMVATAPLIGGHYFCDVVAGVATAAAAIWIASRSGE
jgi:hypothetical protein